MLKVYFANKSFKQKRAKGKGQQEMKKNIRRIHGQNFEIVIQLTIS